MKKIKVYIAAGWFDKFQVEALDYIEKVLMTIHKNKFEVFSPRKEVVLEKDASYNTQRGVFVMNCDKIEDADLIVASTVGKDMGSLWECGYAFANGIPVVYTFFDDRFKDAKFNLMLAQSSVAAFTDKSKFEKFIEKINRDNYKKLKVKYTGEIE